MTYSFSTFDAKASASSASAVENLFNSIQSGASSKSKSSFDFDSAFMSEVKDNALQSRSYDDPALRENKYFSADNRTSIQNNSNDDYALRRQQSSPHEERAEDSGEQESSLENDSMSGSGNRDEEQVTHESVKNESNDKSLDEQREKTVQERSSTAEVKETPKNDSAKHENVSTEELAENKTSSATSSSEKQPLASLDENKEFKAVLESLNLQAGILSASLRKSASAKTEKSDTAETAAQGQTKASSEKSGKKEKLSVDTEAVAKQAQGDAAASLENAGKEKTAAAKNSAESGKTVKTAVNDEALAVALAQRAGLDAELKKNIANTSQQNSGETASAKQTKTTVTTQQGATENKLVKNDTTQTVSAKNLSQLETADLKIQSVKLENVEGEKAKAQTSAAQETESGRLLKNLESRNPEINSRLLSKSATDSNNSSQEKAFSQRDARSEADLKQDLQNAVKTAVKETVTTTVSTAQTQVKTPEFNMNMQNSFAGDSKIQAQNSAQSQSMNDGMPSNLKNISVVQEIMGRIQNTIKGSGYESGMKMSMDIQSGSLGNIQVSLQQSADSIKVSLQSGDDSAKDFLMNQRKDMEQQLKDMGFNHVDVDVSSKEGDARNQNRQLYNALGNEELENVKLAGDDKADMKSLLSALV